jgi:hypothetical protein
MAHGFFGALIHLVWRGIGHRNHSCPAVLSVPRGNTQRVAARVRVAARPQSCRGLVVALAGLVHSCKTHALGISVQQPV